MENQYSCPHQEALESSSEEMAAQKADELNEAVCFDSIETVQKLLEDGAHVNSKVKGGWTPLHSAVQRNKEDLVLFLLDKGADPHARKDNGATPLIVAGIVGNVNLLKLFLEKGSDVNEYDSNGFTAFMETAWHGHEDALSFLYSKKADVNLGRVVDEEKKALNKGGATALMDAARHGHYAIVKALVKEMKADMNTCDNRERNALVHALSVTDTIEWSENKEAVALFLLKNGADVSKRDENGKTTLILAVERQSLRLVEAILEKDEVDINDAGRNSKTALMIAAEKKNNEIAKVLCEKGARTDIGDLLRIAKRTYNNQLTQLLQKYDASPSPGQPSAQCVPSSRRWGSKLQDLHGMYRPMIGKLKVFQYQDFRIKRNSQGGIYLGFYDGNEVAVKIFPIGAENAEREKICLEKCHTSHHLVKLCGWEERKTCLFLCLSLCEQNLEEFFERESNESMKSKDILKEIFLALEELHSFGFGHHDLHPSNILIDFTGKIVVADFDKSRKIADDNKDAIISEDLQALGQLVLYVAMRGKVSFETMGEKCPENVDDCVEIEDLRKSLGSPDKDTQMSEQIKHLICHPYFWDKTTKYRVLRDVGNESHIKTHGTKHHNNTRELLEVLNCEDDPFKGWQGKVGSSILQSMKAPSKKVPNKYEDGVAGLLKMIRDMGEHFDEKEQDRRMSWSRGQPYPTFVANLVYGTKDNRTTEGTKDIIGDPADYFQGLFPNLTLHVYQKLCKTQYNKHFPNAQKLSRN